MTKYELISIVVSSMALLIAVSGTIITFRRLKVAEKAAFQSEKVAQGQLKVTIRDRISQARYQVEEVKLMIDEFKSANPRKSIEKKKKLLNSRLENFFNAYETACNLSLKGNIDKNEFRDEYREEIRDLFESEGLRKYFDSTTSRYQSMIKLYKEWENKN